MTITENRQHRPADHGRIEISSQHRADAITSVRSDELPSYELGPWSNPCANRIGFAGDTSAYRFAATAATTVVGDLGGFWICPNVTKTHHSQRQRPS